MAQHQASGFPKYLSFFTNHLLETAVWTFAELGIADLLGATDSEHTADELAQKQGWNTEFLYRLLRLVADADIVREIKSNETIEPEKTNCFSLTDDGRMLRSDHPSKARYLVCSLLSPLMKRASHFLPDLVREGSSKGTGIEHVIGNISFFDFLKKPENLHVARNFNEAMKSVTTYASQPVVNTVDFARFNTVVDIGGGLGTLLSCILAKYVSIQHGICFDLPNVIRQATIENEFEKRKIPKERYQFAAGDMFDDKTIPRGDVYILKSIIHDWDNDRAIAILQAIQRATAQQKVTIFIIDFIIVSEIDQNQFLKQSTHALDILMMIMHNGKERTQKQYEHLLEKSGFTFMRLYRTETPLSIIEAVTN